jgi:hypothetical protein
VDSGKKAKGKRQKAKGKRQKAKGKRQKAKTLAGQSWHDEASAANNRQLSRGHGPSKAGG